MDMIWVGQHSLARYDHTDQFYQEAIWQLVSLSIWAVSFLERLVKECLFVADSTDMTPNVNEFQPKLEPIDDAGIFALDGTLLYVLHVFLGGSLVPESKQLSSSSPLDSPVLLHLVHPFILPNLIGVIIHVNRFYHLLSVLTPKGENSQMARDILMDVIDCSGLDLRGIEEILKGTHPDVRSIPGKLIYLSKFRQSPNYRDSG